MKENGEGKAGKERGKIEREWEGRRGKGGEIDLRDRPCRKVLAITPLIRRAIY